MFLLRFVVNDDGAVGTIAPIDGRRLHHVAAYDGMNRANVQAVDIGEHVATARGFWLIIGRAFPC